MCSYRDFSANVLLFRHRNWIFKTDGTSWFSDVIAVQYSYITKYRAHTHTNDTRRISRQFQCLRVTPSCSDSRCTKFLCSIILSSSPPVSATEKRAFSTDFRNSLHIRYSWGKEERREVIT